ncbi:hypothetical protein EFN10_03920 [Propionibacterium freudenreichii]|uniref:hypothetical protein n=1 Tax=Propionibacterium freudenreichii TaxID=1744 RepID=UPI0021A6C1C8|nr:hypothetical protein [Propionibacterium freudenreichii]MCT2995280.1 hypothetical protein [Propionibacterium freudenreichii]
MSESTHLDELIAAERAKANARIAKLKHDAAAEQRRVDAKVVEVLKEHHADVYDNLAAQVRELIAAEKAKRSAKAKRATDSSASEPITQAADAPEHSEEVRQAWNG